MRKAIIPAFLLVATSMFLGATVLRDPVAHAAKEATDVFITNDAASPVPVTSTNDPGRAAFAFFENSSFTTGEDSHVSSFDVPAGKRLVIESVSVNGLMDTPGQKLLDGAVQATVNGHLEDYFLAPTFTGTSTSGRAVYIASQQTTLYADGGTTVRVFGTRDATSGGAILNVSVQGHLIDCTAAACG